MMFVTSRLALLSTLAVVGLFESAHAADSAVCAAITGGSGTLVAFFGSDNTYNNEPLQLTSGGLLTYTGATGPNITIEFQECPSAPQASTLDYDYTGRIVVTAPSAEAGQCLTVSDVSASPLYVGVADCTSDTIPDASQVFVFGNDFGNVIFYWGSGDSTTTCDGLGAGIIVNSTSTSNEPILGTNGAIEFGCDPASGSWESMTIE